MTENVKDDLETRIKDLVEQDDVDAQQSAEVVDEQIEEALAVGREDFDKAQADALEEDEAEADDEDLGDAEETLDSNPDEEGEEGGEEDTKDEDEEPEQKDSGDEPEEGDTPSNEAMALWNMAARSAVRVMRLRGKEAPAALTASIESFEAAKEAAEAIREYRKQEQVDVQLMAADSLQEVNTAVEHLILAATKIGRAAKDSKATNADTLKDTVRVSWAPVEGLDPALLDQFSYFGFPDNRVHSIINSIGPLEALLEAVQPLVAGEIKAAIDATATDDQDSRIAFNERRAALIPDSAKAAGKLLPEGMIGNLNYQVRVSGEDVFLGTRNIRPVIKEVDATTGDSREAEKLAAFIAKALRWALESAREISSAGGAAKLLLRRGWSLPIIMYILRLLIALNHCMRLTFATDQD